MAKQKLAGGVLSLSGEPDRQIYIELLHPECFIFLRKPPSRWEELVLLAAGAADKGGCSASKAAGGPIFDAVGSVRPL